MYRAFHFFMIFLQVSTLVSYSQQHFTWDNAEYSINSGRKSLESQDNFHSDLHEEYDEDLSESNLDDPSVDFPLDEYYDEDEYLPPPEYHSEPMITVKIPMDFEDSEDNSADEDHDKTFEVQPTTYPQNLQQKASNISPELQGKYYILCKTQQASVLDSPKTSYKSRSNPSVSHTQLRRKGMAQNHHLLPAYTVGTRQPTYQNIRFKSNQSRDLVIGPKEYFNCSFPLPDKVPLPITYKTAKNNYYTTRPHYNKHTIPSDQLTPQFHSFAYRFITSNLRLTIKPNLNHTPYYSEGSTIHSTKRSGVYGGSSERKSIYSDSVYTSSVKPPTSAHKAARYTSSDLGSHSSKYKTNSSSYPKFHRSSKHTTPKPIAQLTSFYKPLNKLSTSRNYPEPSKEVKYITKSSIHCVNNTSSYFVSYKPSGYLPYTTARINSSRFTEYSKQTKLHDMYRTKSTPKPNKLYYSSIYITPRPIHSTKIPKFYTHDSNASSKKYMTSTAINPYVYYSSNIYATDIHQSKYPKKQNYYTPYHSTIHATWRPKLYPTSSYKFNKRYTTSSPAKYFMPHMLYTKAHSQIYTSTSNSHHSALYSPISTKLNHTSNPYNTYQSQSLKYITYKPKIHVPNTYKPNIHVPGTYKQKIYVPSTYKPNIHVPSTYKPKIHVLSTYKPKIHVTSSYEPKIHVTSPNKPKIHVTSSYEPNIHVSSTYKQKIYVPSTYKPNIHVTSSYEPKIHVIRPYKPKIHVTSTYKQNIYVPSSYEPNIHVSSTYKQKIYVPSTYKPNIHVTSSYEPKIHVIRPYKPKIHVTSTYKQNIYVPSSYEPNIHVSSTYKQKTYVPSTYKPNIHVTSSYEPKIHVTRPYKPKIHVTSTYKQKIYVPSSYEPNIHVSSTYKQKTYVPSTYKPNIHVTSSYEPKIHVTRPYKPKIHVTSTYKQKIYVPSSYEPNIHVSSTYKQKTYVPSTYKPNIHVTSSYEPKIHVTRPYKPKIHVTSTYKQKIYVPSSYEPNIHVSSTYKQKTYVPSTYKPNIHVTSSYEPKIHVTRPYKPKIHVTSTYKRKIYVPSTYKPNIHVPGTYNQKIYVPSPDKPKIHVLSTYKPKIHVPSSYEPKIHVTSSYEPKIHVTGSYEPKIHVTSSYEPKIHVTSSYEPKIHVTSTYTPIKHVRESYHQEYIISTPYYKVHYPSSEISIGNQTKCTSEHSYDYSSSTSSSSNNKDKIYLTNTYETTSQGYRYITTPMPRFDQIGKGHYKRPYPTYSHHPIGYEMYNKYSQTGPLSVQSSGYKDQTLAPYQHQGPYPTYYLQENHQRTTVKWENPVPVPFRPYNRQFSTSKRRHRVKVKRVQVNIPLFSARAATLPEFQRYFKTKPLGLSGKRESNYSEQKIYGYARVADVM